MIPYLLFSGLVKIIGWCLLVLICFFIFVYLFFYFKDKRILAPKQKDISWGVTFSQTMSTDLGLDWKTNYGAILNNLKPSAIRLVAYWNLVQPQPDTWSFDDLDWQMEEAKKANIPVVLTIGQRVPRWPECHYPDWLDKDNQREREDKLTRYIETMVQRYRDYPNLLAWQVENEAFLKLVYIKCPSTSKEFVDKEIKIVKALDPGREVIVTDSGQVGTWYKAAQLGDSLGVTFYRKVYRLGLGAYKYPYFLGRITFSRWLAHKPQQPLYVMELQAEPWGDKPIQDMTPVEAEKFFSLDDFHAAIKQSEVTGATRYYFWGAEWWYAIQQKGIPTYWDAAKSYMVTSKPLVVPQKKTETLTFPKGFLWGASTAAHQVEGNLSNDWTAWEKTQALKLAQTATEKYAPKLPHWPEIASQATDPQNYISGKAADMATRYQDDFTLAQSLNMNAQRISVEWSQIEPKEGQFDQSALDHYHDEVKALREHGMEPMVTLWHWTFPQWLSDQGGWLAPKSDECFARFAAKLADTFGDDVSLWITVNEPGVYASNSYLLGTRPPQQRNPLAYLHSLRRLQLVHQAAYVAIKNNHPKAQIGMAQDMYSYAPYKNRWNYRGIARIARWWTNQHWLSGVTNQLDFIGINYYAQVPIGPLRLPGKPDNQLRSDLGWALHPEGIYNVLIGAKRYNKPIYITESGLADAQDVYRAWYITETLRSVHQAMDEGVVVKGYFHWSLMDNFEWEKGFWPRFGLIGIDYSNLTRQIRSSAKVYAEIAKSNRLEF